jgi:hypothetical protein
MFIRFLQAMPTTELLEQIRVPAESHSWSAAILVDEFDAGGFESLG